MRKHISGLLVFIETIARKKRKKGILPRCFAIRSWGCNKPASMLNYLRIVFEKNYTDRNALYDK